MIIIFVSKLIESWIAQKIIHVDWVQKPQDLGQLIRNVNVNIINDLLWCTDMDMCVRRDTCDFSKKYQHDTSTTY